MYRSNRGFTLIELLVVITIIGILVALIIPAVNMVREESRQTKCLNNQIQLGKAIIAYEAAKNKLPGVLNQTQQVGGAVGTMVPYNWVEAIFPYLDRADLWDAVITGKTTSIAQSALESYDLPQRSVPGFCPHVVESVCTFELWGQRRLLRELSQEPCCG